MRETTETFKGLVYVKIGRIGTRSEGPDYYLQTARGEFLLRYQERNLWQPDYHLEFFQRRMVEVSGTLDDKLITVTAIAEILAPSLPRDPVQVKLAAGAAMKVDDITVGFVEVSEDSRCPTGAVCVWAGLAVAGLWAARGASPTGPGPDAERFTLTTGNAELGTKAVLGKRVTLLQVEPHPAVGVQIDPKQYVITLAIESL
jgi:hypothetical protein